MCPLPSPALLPRSGRTLLGEASYTWRRQLTADAHNHFSHSALSRYALGATAPLIDADWVYDRQHLAPLDPIEGGREREIKTLDLPDKFTTDNWADKKWYERKG